jgi:hypothetical protein
MYDAAASKPIALFVSWKLARMSGASRPKP